MQGYMLDSAEHGKKSNNQTYKFPAKLVLQPGDRFAVWSGKKNEKKGKEPGSALWTKR